MKFEPCFLTEYPSGKDIAVNPNLVRIIMQIGEETVDIVFDNECRVTIKGALVQTAEAGHIRHKLAFEDAIRDAKHG
jgi:hypothetical protein